MTVRNHIFMTEIVNGICPNCTFPTTLIGLDSTLYRCTRCGDELEQKKNGVIKYINSQFDKYQEKEKKNDRYN